MLRSMGFLIQKRSVEFGGLCIIVVMKVGVGMFEWRVGVILVVVG